MPVCFCFICVSVVFSFNVQTQVERVSYSVCLIKIHFLRYILLSSVRVHVCMQGKAYLQGVYPAQQPSLSVISFTVYYGYHSIMY